MHRDSKLTVQEGCSKSFSSVQLTQCLSKNRQCYLHAFCNVLKYRVDRARLKYLHRDEHSLFECYQKLLSFQMQREEQKTTKTIRGQTERSPSERFRHMAGGEKRAVLRTQHCWMLMDQLYLPISFPPQETHFSFNTEQPS